MHATLIKILSLKDKREFINQIKNFVFKPDLNQTYANIDAPLPRFVEFIKEIGVFELNVTNGGMWLYLSEESGSPKVLLQACRAIGAAKTEQYVAAVQAHFPGGTIPDDRDERQSLLDALEISLGKEDKRFDDTLDITLFCLQQFLIQNLSETEKQIEEFWKQYGTV
jgi:hypothetical protein